MRMTYEDFTKLWFVATEKENIGSKYYKKHLGVLGELKDFIEWFFKNDMKLSRKEIKELKLDHLDFAMRVLVSHSAIMVLSHRMIDIENIEEALNDGLDFEYGYKKYLEWRSAKDSENMKIEIIHIDAKKGDNTLLVEVAKKRNKKGDNVKKLRNVEFYNATKKLDRKLEREYS